MKAIDPYRKGNLYVPQSQELSRNLSTDYDLRSKLFPITVPILGNSFFTPAGASKQLPDQSEITIPLPIELEGELDGLAARFSVSSAGRLLRALRYGPSMSPAEYISEAAAKSSEGIPGDSSDRGDLRDRDLLGKDPFEKDPFDGGPCSGDPYDLLCPRQCAEYWKSVGVIPYPHQLETLRRVVNEFHGRAILADEVGLGKTIEAGMILKEYLLRREVDRALILVPPALCWQWYVELREKFGISSAIQCSDRDWTRHKILIASLDTAKRSPHREVLATTTYDMLIVDEAHRSKNDRTENWKLVDSIEAKYRLLLTATPIQNNLKELYNLVNLVRPGILGTWASFSKKHVSRVPGTENTSELKQALSGVLIRNRRQQTALHLPPRTVTMVDLSLSDEERRLYDSVIAFAKRQFAHRRASKLNPLPFITLLREVCSSAFAVLLTLRRMKEAGCLSPEDRTNLTELISLAQTLERGAKLDVLWNLLQSSDEQFIIFTEYRATLALIQVRLQQEGVTVLGFDGSMSASKKAWTRYQFMRGTRVLVSTDSGGEGLNFQFCRNIINFDMPWNPMKVEQRIGRLHRLGQTREVRVFNLSTRGTVEEYILKLLHEKIGLFTRVIGDLDAIVLELEKSKSLEAQIGELFLTMDDQITIEEGLNRIADRFHRFSTKSGKASGGCEIESVL